MVRYLEAYDGDESVLLRLAHRLGPTVFVAWILGRFLEDPECPAPRDRDHLAEVVLSSRDHVSGLEKDTVARPLHEEKVQGLRNVAAPGGPCVDFPGGHPSARGPSILDDGARRDGATPCRDVKFAGGDVRAGCGASPGRHGQARLGGVGGHHMDSGADADAGAGADPARPDASPVTNNRHCSPDLLGSCPPACLQCMGSARANRSGWLPVAVWKELVR